MQGLTVEPDIPLALWLPLTLLAGGLWVAYVLASRRRLQGRVRPLVLALMLLALALPLAILLNPTWIEPIPPPAGKPHLTVLVDSSASMATTDGAEGASRYAEALRLAGQLAASLKEPFDVHFRSVAEESMARDLTALTQAEPAGMLTDLAAGLEQSLGDRPQGQALLLLSDGIHNAGGSITALRQGVAKAHAMAAPIYVKTLGRQSNVRDLEVTLKLPQEMAFADQAVPVVASVRQRGTLVDRAVVTLTLDGAPSQQQEVRLAADASVETTFHVVQADAGLYRYEVQVASQTGEVTDVNNTATFLLRVVDEPVRVLLLEGKPYWDTKFLARTLAADPSVDLTTLVRLADNRYLQRHVARAVGPDDSNPPTGSHSGAAPRAEEWTTQSNLDGLLSGTAGFTSYQVVLLGRDAETLLDDSRVAQLKKWLIEDNGSLVCFRGSPATQVSQRMAELMPVRWSPSRESRFRVQLTESGRAAQWLPAREDGQDVLANLPSLATVAQPRQPKPLAIVMATTAASGEGAVPVISYQPVGNGRVVVVEGGGMWRWAFLPPEHQQFDETYGMLWRSLVRWLVSNAGLLPSQQAALRSDKVTFGTAETVTATLLVRETGAAGPPAVELSGGILPASQSFVPIPDGSWLGQFRVEFGKLPEGRYRARVAGMSDASSTTAAFDVRSNLSERLDVAARPNVMHMLAEESGGAVLEDDLPRELSEHFQNYLAASRPQRSAQTIAWDRWWVLLLVFGIWAAAWGLRRRSGLV
ncbi:MAG: hypothetical protein ACYC4U_00970 [Pirellulaceae bacterium]